MIDTSEVKVVVFDLDRTLVPTDLEKIFFNIVIPMYISGRKGICYENARKLFYDELERLKETSEALFFSLEAISQVTGIKYDDLIKILSELCHICVKPYPYVVETLKFLKKKGIKIVVLTDTDAAIALHKVNAAGISKFIEKIISATEIFGSRKNSYIYQKLFEFLKALDYVSDKKQILVVGDDIERDYNMPRQAGLQALLLSKKKVVPESIRSLKDLISLFK